MHKPLSYLSLIISIISISICFSFVSLDETKVTFNSLISVAGLIITALGFLLGSYFAFIAVRAYQYLSDIEQIHNQLSNLDNERNMILTKYTEFILDNIDHQLNLELTLLNTDESFSNSVQQRSNELYLLRSRMSYMFSNMDKTRRTSLMMELGQLGNQEDIIPLEELLGKTDSSCEFYNVIQTTLEAIRERNIENV